ncbi:hypothetical protein [Rhodococcus qingshengii]|uniref:hypothetical protein n=1 Tax=Rhodococcus qingshengii TaxID=334542 RepID=UPI001F5B07B2|nr:hypothetical protein [Rhodococcus qingshengii]
MGTMGTIGTIGTIGTTGVAGVVVAGVVVAGVVVAGVLVAGVVVGAAAYPTLADAFIEAGRTVSNDAKIWHCAPAVFQCRFSTESGMTLAVTE